MTDDRYDILEELGRGGMGIVYKAMDRETSECVALKVLRPEVLEDALVMQRFKNELRIARKITHKNVCRIYEFTNIRQGPCISMEYVEGATLRQNSDENTILYGKEVDNRDIVTTGMRVPQAAARLIALLNRYSARERSH